MYEFVCIICLQCLWSQAEGSDILDVEFRAVGSHQLWVLGLCKSSKCS